MADVSRRRFFGFGAALLAAPAIVKISAIMPVSTVPASISQLTVTEALALSMVETKEMYAANVLTLMNVYRFREIIMPGLRAIEGTYDDLDAVFAT